MILVLNPNHKSLSLIVHHVSGVYGQNDLLLKKKIVLNPYFKLIIKLASFLNSCFSCFELKPYVVENYNFIFELKS